jgi:HSP20 family molecular chaperone IbpA
MANVSTKSLILSQPKANQTETIAAPTLPYTSATTETSTQTKVEIPGVDPSTVNVDFEGGAIFIQCERGVLTIPVDPTIDVVKIKADILWGMLTVDVPLPKPPVSRSIKVSVSDTLKHASSKNQSKFTDED